MTMNQAGLEWLLNQEKAGQAELLAQCFGYYLLLFTLQEKALIPSCPIKQSIVVRPKAAKLKQEESVVADWTDLPFAPDSIDLLVLSHVFDWYTDIQSLLKEIKLVLRHDGKLLISGFNPGRLRARNLAKCYHSGELAEKNLQLKLCSSVMFMLQNEGFEICEVRHYGFFGIKNRGLGKYLNKICQFFPGLACGYLILGQKKVLGAIAAKPNWQKPLLDPEKVRVPTSYRVK